MRFWTHAQWARLPEPDRPGEAQRLGTAGWVVLDHVDLALRPEVIEIVKSWGDLSESSAD